MPPHDIEPTILRSTGGVHPLDESFIDEEDLAKPWQRSESLAQKLGGPMPSALNLTLANLVYFEKAQLPQSLANRLIRLAAFQNPEFYKAQAMRLSVWDKPRVIGSAENFPLHIALPRGCLEPAIALLKDNGIHCEIDDERHVGDRLAVSFSNSGPRWSSARFPRAPKVAGGPARHSSRGRASPPSGRRRTRSCRLARHAGR